MNSRWFLPLVLALASCTFHCSAQQPGDAAGVITGIGHVAYRVSDLEKELAFLAKLGFEQSFGFPAGGKVNQVFVKVSDREFIELYQQTAANQPLGWMHVCYEAGDINALVAAIASRGLKPTPVRKAAAGNLISSLDDPEGRTTEFTQYMPGSRHTLDRGLHLGANRIATRLLGFELPVPSLDADKPFYVGLGFPLNPTKTGLRARITSAPEPYIDLRASAPGLTPQLLFRVSSAKEAAAQIRAQSLPIASQGKRISVNDPDGNVFVFVQ